MTRWTMGLCLRGETWGEEESWGEQRNELGHSEGAGPPRSGKLPWAGVQGQMEETCVVGS